MQIQERIQRKAGESDNYSEKGLLYQACLKKFEKYKDSSQDFADALIQAIDQKIWLGFVNPISGQFCSFIHHGDDGSIDDAISFKIFLASPAKVGGLGILEISQLEALLRGNKLAMKKALPLIASKASITETNKALAERGEKPILPLPKAKAYFLRKIENAPALIQDLFEPLSQNYQVEIAKAYERAFSEAENIIEIDQKLESLLKQKEKLSKEELKDQILDILSMPKMAKIKIPLENPNRIAQRLFEVIAKDKIEALIQALQSQLDELEEC